MSSTDAVVGDAGSTIELLEQPFASSKMRDSMDLDLLLELSGETWMAVTQLSSATNETVTDIVLPAGFKLAGSTHNSGTATHDQPSASSIPNSRTAPDDLLPAGFELAGCKPHPVTVADESLPTGSKPASFQPGSIPVTSYFQPAGFDQNLTTAPRLDTLTDVRETWVAATHLDEVTGDLPPAGSELDLISASRSDKSLTIVREWVQSGSPPIWSDCVDLSPELQFGNLLVDSDDRLWRHRAPPAMTLQWAGASWGASGVHLSIP